MGSVMERLSSEALFPAMLQHRRLGRPRLTTGSGAAPWNERVGRILAPRSLLLGGSAMSTPRILPHRGIGKVRYC